MFRQVWTRFEKTLIAKVCLIITHILIFLQLEEVKALAAIVVYISAFAAAEVDGGRPKSD